MIAGVAIFGAFLAGLYWYSSRIAGPAIRAIRDACTRNDQAQADAFHAALMAQRGEDFARDAVIHIERMG